MDILELSSIDLAFGNKVKAPNVAVHQYVEFMVNDEPLSDLLHRHFKLKETVLSKYTSTLGTMAETNFDRLKVLQLLDKKPGLAEVENLFPATQFDQKPILDELNLGNVLIYCCAECGDYKCGGFFATIWKGEKSFTWLFEKNGKELQFEFEAKEYEALLNTYVKELD